MLAVDISHRSCETRLDSIEAGQVYDIDGAIRRGGPGEKRRRGKESFGVDGEGRYVQSLEELFPGSRSFQSGTGERKDEGKRNPRACIAID